MSDTASLVLRLAGPLQSWGTTSQFNRREAGSMPSKSGVIGMLAAAEGRRRADPIDDLVALRLGVRIDEPGTQLRDYHTVSDYRAKPLLSTAVDKAGVQKPTTPQKITHVTQRFYLQDALFVAAVGGRRDVIEGLVEALQHPVFPLALGRRSCVPAQPLLVRVDGALVSDRDPASILATLPWQVSEHQRLVAARRHGTRPPVVTLEMAVDADGSDAVVDLLSDVPVSFEPGSRGFITRRVSRRWVTVPSGHELSGGQPGAGDHDPFALLGA